MLSYFGKEHYCPLSLFRVFGTSMMEELEDHEAGSQDDNDVIDHDDDIVQILPHDPSAKSEDKTKQPNILATVGDTLMNMVKHAAKKLTGVIKDSDSNGTNEKDSEGVSTVAASSNIASSVVVKQQEEHSKPSIVTLIPSEEGDNLPLNKTTNETANDANNTQAKSPDKTTGNATNVNSSFYDKVDSDSNKGYKSTSSFTYCKMVVRMLGHPGFGCFMGRVLYSKRKNHHGFTPKEKAPKTPKARQSNNIKDAIQESVNVADTKADKEESKKDSEKDGEKKSEKVEEKEKEIKPKTPDQDEKPMEKLKDIGNNSESIINNNDDNNKQTIETIKDVTTNTDQTKEIQATPSVNSQPMDPLSMIQPSDSQQSVEHLSDSTTESTPSLTTLSSLETEPSREATESTTPKSPTPHSKPTLDQVKRSTEQATMKSEALSNQTKIVDDSPSVSKEMDSGKAAESESVDCESKKPSASSVEETINSKGSCTSVQPDDHSLIKPSLRTTPSECAAPTIMPDLKDVDVLEFKLLDSTGREGTAHLEKPVNLDKPVQPEKPVEDSDEEKKDEDKDKEEKSEKKDMEDAAKPDKPPLIPTDSSKAEESSLSTTSSVVEPSKVEPIVIVSTPSVDGSKAPPTTPPPREQALEESIQPKPPPPVISESSVDPPETVEASLVDEVSKPSSSAVNQGQLSSGAQKESIFMRLTNRIKALEQNLTLSTLYMEKLNQK